MPPFGLLLIGGNQTHQENYARGLAADGRCKLVAISDGGDISPPRHELSQQLARELAIPYVPDLDAALAREDVQVVCLCPEPERREALTIRCAQAGKHLYLDKEIATTVAGVRRVAQAIREAGVFSQTFSLVHTSLGRRAKQALERDAVGPLLSLHAELFFAKGQAGTADLSRPRQERAAAERFTFMDSKRELLCVGWYPLVLFSWLTGRKVRSVYATTSNYFFAEHQRNDVEDYACLMLELEGDLTGTVTCGRTGWSSHPGQGVHQVQLVGRTGSLMLDAFRPRLEIFSDTPPWTQPPVPHPEDPMGFWTSTSTQLGVKPKTSWKTVEPELTNDFRYFVDCLAAQHDSDVPAALGAHVVEVILAAYRSAAERRPVSIEI